MNVVSLLHHHDIAIVSPPPYFHYLITITTTTSHCYCVTTHTAIIHPHSYCFINTTTSTMSFRCRNKDALKNAKIEEGLQFRTLELGLVEVLMLTCCLRRPFPSPFGQATWITLLWYLPFSFRMLFCSNGCSVELPNFETTIGRKREKDVVHNFSTGSSSNADGDVNENEKGKKQ